jgi:hypothetical protein
MGEILAKEGENMNIKVFSAEFNFAMDVNLQSPNIGRAANMLLNSLVIPYI